MQAQLHPLVVVKAFELQTQDIVGAIRYKDINNSAVIKATVKVIVKYKYTQAVALYFWQVLGSEARTDAGKAKDKDSVRRREKGKRMNCQGVGCLVGKAAEVQLLPRLNVCSRVGSMVLRSVVKQALQTLCHNIQRRS